MPKLVEQILSIIEDGMKSKKLKALKDFGLQAIAAIIKRENHGRMTVS
ncbi:MAG: hypothetical protein RM338_13040 [Nostoc sp. DedQUE12a]|nr:hypothetical protein [Nostoc sp. DedQUE12a]